MPAYNTCLWYPRSSMITMVLDLPQAGNITGLYSVYGDHTAHGDPLLDARRSYRHREPGF
jgi:hypothetical protein